jgi:hypothetical protein
MSTLIKITQLTNIGGQIAANSVLPVVNMTGTPETQKTTVQNMGNIILAGAGSANYVPANIANIAYSVVNAAQPNVTSVGTLVNLVTSGNVTLANIIIGGNTNPGAATDTTIAFKIPVTINGNTYYLALTAAP